jgi:LPXTG-site transpeptidase (sortase) family protein
VGEDLAGPPLDYTDFTETFVIVQATEDSTSVQIDDPNSGTFNVTLNRGEVTELFHIFAGTTIQASAPVQAQFIVGQPNVGPLAPAADSRSYTAVPSGLWAPSYYSPVPSFGGESNTDVFIYNPTGSALAINYEDSSGSGTFILPANGTRSYEDLTGRFVPENSALFLEAADGVTNFWAVGSANTEDADFNYGFTFVPSPLLADEYFISWAPGTTDFTANGSPVFVTPTVDNTTIYVDYSPANGDGSFDASVTLDRIEVERFFDPDNDNTGMHIWADNPIAAVWGEDADIAEPGNPYIDAGYTILPLTLVSEPPDPPATPTVPPPGPGDPGNPGGGRPAGFIPVTGFAPDRVTDLSGLPVIRYNATNGVTLEVPTLKLNMPIVGVPKQGNTWDVNWLLNQAGWLEGTAFPGFSGNSVLTSHVTLSYGQAGPFSNLHKLKVGDMVFVRAFGNLYIYGIKSIQKLDATDPSILRHEEKPWLTLVTCADYDENAGTYLKRLVVRAEFLQAQPERWWHSWP